MTILRELAEVLIKDVCCPQSIPLLGISGPTREQPHEEPIGCHIEQGLIEIYPEREGHTLLMVWQRIPMILDRCSSVVLGLCNNVRVIVAEGKYADVPITVKVYLGPRK